MANPVISRREWGAQAPRPGGLTRRASTRRQVLHHSAGAFPKTPAAEAAEVRRIQHYHRNVVKPGESQPWTDIGYHLLVGPSGRIYRGRSAGAVGAGVYGENHDTVHVCALGNFETNSPTKAQLDGIVKAFRLLDGTGRPLFGHRQLGPTACPGRNLQGRIAEIARLR